MCATKKWIYFSFRDAKQRIINHYIGPNVGFIRNHLPEFDSLRKVLFIWWMFVLIWFICRSYAVGLSLIRAVRANGSRSLSRLDYQPLGRIYPGPGPVRFNYRPSYPYKIDVSCTLCHPWTKETGVELAAITAKFITIGHHSENTHIGGTLKYTNRQTLKFCKPKKQGQIVLKKRTTL